MTLPDGVAAAIIEHAREAAPQECCGLLIGTAAGVTTAVRARNTADEPTRRYRIDPRDHFAAVRLARNRGQDIVGAYHSHPRSGAVPSVTDASEAFSHFCYLIIGLGPESPELRAWTWVDGNFTVMPLVRVP